MKHKTLYWLLGACAAVCVALNFLESAARWLFSSFVTFPFQQLHQVIVCQRHILHKDLTDNTDPRLADRFIDGKAVKCIDDPTAYLLIGVLRFGIDE